MSNTRDMDYEIIIDYICGNDEETQVFARTHDTRGLELIFRTTKDDTRPLSIASRVVACFHQLPTASPDETFQDRASMRMALKTAILQSWSSCVHVLQDPDAVIDLMGGGLDAKVDWEIQHEDVLYQRYLDALAPKNTQDILPKSRHYSFIDRGDLILVRLLSGRGTSAVVRRRSSVNEASLFVLKSVDFVDFLVSEHDFMHERDVFYNTIKTISSISPHPNIMSPPNFIVTTSHQSACDQEDPGKAVICGTLYPFMSRGTLDDQITRSKRGKLRMSLQDKARWCLQLSSALEHTHRVARTYHMDIKPSNVLVDDDGNAILIDWEQSGAPTCTLAPEANGDWDVEEVQPPAAPIEEVGASVPKLTYTRYNGPTRVNLPLGWPKWNVFPEWIKRWPRACEAAEVFSLGRTLWMLLAEVSHEDVMGEDCDSIVVEWDVRNVATPDSWKTVVMSCMERNPNDRVDLGILVEFWQRQQQVEDER